MNTISMQEEERYEELMNIAMDFARGNEEEQLKLMIDAGLNVNLKNNKGDSLLMLASYHNALSCVKMLITKGARVDEKNDRGQTPLAGACFKGYFEVVRALVESGANIDENNGLGATPYTFALMFGHKEIAKYLLERSKPSLLKKISLKALTIFK